MSSKTNREQDLLLFLSKNQGYVTSKELVEELKISQKTVYRLIKKINDEYMDTPLIISERGRGYKLDYENFINYKKAITNTNKNIFLLVRDVNALWKNYCCLLLSL
ncbi:helix-turn-helix domain-containing protein [Bacillus sp. JCM 19034]|uniref:helix-turn-helix domain-containing protein n=1 Tax=Bacillus sp. JCM 19034 TaxID=1481928 RepID=UPI0007852228